MVSFKFLCLSLRLSLAIHSTTKGISLPIVYLHLLALLSIIKSISVLKFEKSMVEYTFLFLSFSLSLAVNFNEREAEVYNKPV